MDQLIRANIERAEEFIWASQLKFFWEEASNDESNITVRQLHLNLKYGNEFLGSLTKVIIQNEAELLLGLRLSEPVSYAGNYYCLERIFNSIGYKMTPFYCSPATTHLQLSQFAIGCYYSDFLPVLSASDLLPPQVKYSIDFQTWINDFHSLTLRKPSAYVRDVDRPFTLFCLLRDTSTTAYAFGGTFRVVNYLPPSSAILKSGMQLLGISSPEKNQLLLRLFELIRFIEERSELQGVALELFLDGILAEEAALDEYHLFSRFLTHLKHRVAVETHHALTKHLETLGVVTIKPEPKQKNSRMGEIVECLWERGVVILGGRGSSKKHTLDLELAKAGVSAIRVFGKSLPASQLFSAQFMDSLLGQYPEQEKHVFYVEEITTDLLLAIEKLVYF